MTNWSPVPMQKNEIAEYFGVPVFARKPTKHTHVFLTEKWNIVLIKNTIIEDTLLSFILKANITHFSTIFDSKDYPTKRIISLNWLQSSPRDGILQYVRQIFFFYFFKLGDFLCKNVSTKKITSFGNVFFFILPKFQGMPAIDKAGCRMLFSSIVQHFSKHSVIYFRKEIKLWRFACLPSTKLSSCQSSQAQSNHGAPFLKAHHPAVLLYITLKHVLMHFSYHF